MEKEIIWKIVWTEPAVCDLERIDRYLRRRNLAAAERLGESLLKRVQILEKFPEIGRLYLPEARWRVLSFKNYKVYYRVRVDDRTVEICHVRHGARMQPTEDDLLTD